MRVPILALLLLAAPSSRAQEPAFAWPKTKVATVAEAWFTALGAGTDEAAAAFERAHRAASELERKGVEARVKSWAQLRPQFGGIAPRRVLADAELALALVASADAEKGPQFRVAFQLEPAEPHKLQKIEIRPYDPDEPQLGTYATWKDLGDLLAQVRSDTGIPAIAAAVVRGDEIVDAAAVGVRAHGSEEKVALDDRFHVGSVTKSMTATMIGALVDEGVLAWDLTAAQALPELKMREDFGAATLAQILRHRAGVPAYLAMDAAKERALLGLTSDPRAQRAAFLAAILQEEPVGPRGEHFEYSNAGYALAAHMAETKAKKPWEALLAEKVFAPLELETAIIGWPAAAGREAEPHGHFEFGAKIRVQQLGEYPLGGHIAPAGNVACSIRDLARYARAHLQGLRGKDGVLRAATVRALHEPGEGGSVRYAAGWMIAEKDGALVHWHNGSAGTFFAQVELEPASDLAVVVAANVGQVGQPAAEKIASLVRTRYRPAR